MAFLWCVENCSKIFDLIICLIILTCFSMCRLTKVVFKFFSVLSASLCNISSNCFLKRLSKLHSMFWDEFSKELFPEKNIFFYGIFLTLSKLSFGFLAIVIWNDCPNRTLHVQRKFLRKEKYYFINIFIHLAKLFRNWRNLFCTVVRSSFFVSGGKCSWNFLLSLNLSLRNFFGPFSK